MIRGVNSWGSFSCEGVFRDGLIASWKKVALLASRVFTSGMQVARYIGSTLARIDPRNHLVIGCGAVASAVGVIFGLKDFYQGWQARRQAQTIHDREGVRRGGERLVSGTLAFHSAALGLSAVGVNGAGVSATAAASLAAAAGYTLGVGFAWAMGVTALGVYRCSHFRLRLNKQADGLEDASQCIRTLTYLQDTVNVTDTEKKELVAKIDREDPNAPFQEKEKRLAQALLDRAAVKRNYFKRRTTQKALSLVLDQTQSLLDNLQDPKLQQGAVIKARQLIADIKSENGKKIRLYVVAFLAAAIGFAAFIAGTVFTAGVLPLILFAISATIYLSMTLYSLYSYLTSLTSSRNNGIK